MSPVVSSSASNAVMSPVAVISSASADDKPPSPPIIRRTSEGALSDLDVPSHLNFPPSPTTCKGSHRKICSWKLGDDDTTAVNDSSGSGDDLSEEIITKQIDKNGSSSCASNHPALKPRSKPHGGGVGSGKFASDIPQSVDEHSARLKEIIHEGGKKKRKNNKIGAKHVDTYCSDDMCSDVNIEPKYSTMTEDDRESGVSSGNNTSNIFAATRAKLKGYLTAYSRKKKNKGHKAGPTAETASPISPELNLSIRNVQSMNEVSQRALPSIQESKANNSHEEICSNSPHTPTSRSSQKIVEGRTPQVSQSTPEANDENKSPSCIVPSSSAKPYLPCINLFPEKDFTTRVINLPWSESSPVGDKIGESKPRVQLLRGKYSGPVNDFLQPHGKGKLILKTNSSQAFYGAWRDGKLVSPLTVEEVPATDAGSDRERRRENAFSSLEYAADKNRRMPINAPSASEDAALVKAANKSRKPKPLVGYNLGDACRSSQDMIICSSRQEAIESAGLLNKWDGAFIKRSCGVWTYAVLVERAPQPVNIIKRRLEYSYWTTWSEVDPRYEMEDSMMFVINCDGGTKIIPKHAWAKYVRRLNPSPLPNLAESHTVQVPFRESRSRLFSRAART